MGVIPYDDMQIIPMNRKFHIAGKGKNTEFSNPGTAMQYVRNMAGIDSGEKKQSMEDFEQEELWKFKRAAIDRARRKEDSPPSEDENTSTTEAVIEPPQEYTFQYSTLPDMRKYNKSNDHDLFGTVYFTDTNQGIKIHEIDDQIIMVDIPEVLREYFLYDGNKASRIPVFKYSKKNWEMLFDLLQQPMENGEIYATLISEYNGAYNKRYQRGSQTQLSEHSFGLAIDINKNDSVMTYYYDPKMKQYTTGEFFVNDLYDKEKGYIIPYNENDPNCAINLQHPNYILYKNCFEPAGFKWGMEFDKRYDGMHFEVDTLYGE